MNMFVFMCTYVCTNVCVHIVCMSMLGLGNNRETAIIIPLWSHDNHTVKIF